MKKSITILLIIMTTINLMSSQNVVDISETIEKQIDGEMILFVNDEKFTGIVLQDWENKRHSKNYKDGKLDGVYKVFYNDGSLRFYGILKNNKKHGLCKWYYENGHLEEKGNYYNGNQFGFHEWYYKNGKLKEKSTIKNGEYISTQKFPENKETVLTDLETDESSDSFGVEELVVDISETIEKQIDGEWILFVKGEKFTGVVLSNWSNKELADSKTYKDGKLNGLYKKYYENGSLKFYGNFKNDNKHDLCRWYYKNGHLEEKGYFDNGNPNGLLEWYYENGNLKQKGYFDNGLKSGLYELYDKSGQLNERRNYIDDKFTSTQKFPENKEFKQQNVLKYESFFPIPLEGWKASDVKFDISSPYFSLVEGILLSRVYTHIKTDNQIEISIDTAGDLAMYIAVIEELADFTNSEKKEIALKFKHQNYRGYKIINKKNVIIEIKLVINYKVALIISAKNQNIEKDIILNYLKLTNIYKIEEFLKLSILDLF